MKRVRSTRRNAMLVIGVVRDRNDWACSGLERASEAGRECPGPGGHASRGRLAGGSPQAVGLSSASDDAAAESGQTRGSGRGWGRTGTSAPSTSPPYACARAAGEKAAYAPNDRRRFVAF